VIRAHGGVPSAGAPPQLDLGERHHPVPGALRVRGDGPDLAVGHRIEEDDERDVRVVRGHPQVDGSSNLRGK
jgi:hypothetical protein